MDRRCALVALFFCLQGCSETPATDSAVRVPELLIDGLHDQAVATFAAPKNYQLEPCDSLVLRYDPLAFTIVVQDSLPVVNCIHVTVSSGAGGQVYRVPFSGEAQTRLDGKSMVPLMDSTPFVGFPAGSKVILAVGADGWSEQSAGINLNVYWAGLIDVR